MTLESLSFQPATMTLESNEFQPATMTLVILTCQPATMTLDTLSFLLDHDLIQEFTCILHGLLYFVSVPSMSLLLFIYSLGNLHVVSWGTREVAKPVSSTTEPNAKKRNAMKRWMSKITGGLDMEAYSSASSLLR